MLPASLPTAAHSPPLNPAEEAIARSVLYSALFDYPLTLAQLRQTLIGSQQTASEIVGRIRRSHGLMHIVEERDGYFFPAGRVDLIDVRRERETRSRAFLSEHGLLLRLIAGLPYVRMLALSGSIAHLNLEAGGDVDIFVVTRGRHVWSTAVVIILLAKLLRRRKTLCANYIVADTALGFGQQDLFTASQVINLRPLYGHDAYRALLAANSFVRTHYPNFHPVATGHPPMRRSRVLDAAKRIGERVLRWPAALFERACRTAYGSYLRGRASSWQSPEQVVLGDTVLKLHTRSHRKVVMQRFDEAITTSDLAHAHDA